MVTFNNRLRGNDIDVPHFVLEDSMETNVVSKDL